MQFTGRDPIEMWEQNLPTIIAINAGPGAEPVHEHDCEGCVFLGNVWSRHSCDKWDLWQDHSSIGKREPVFIIRFGIAGDYYGPVDMDRLTFYLQTNLGG